MSAEKPIHVRVAEALGWTHIHPVTFTGYPPEGPINGNPSLPPGPLLSPRLGCALVPRYDTDWSATGPLIERLGVTLLPKFGLWHAELEGEECRTGQYETPLRAVCALILALAADGKLEKVA